MRRDSFLDTGHNIKGVVRLCRIARFDSRYTDLFMKSEIRLKKSFLSYLDFCKEKNLIEKVQVKTTNRCTRRKHPFYRTTEAGHQLLTILGENN